MPLTPVEEIKQKLDVVEIIGEYVRLTKSGRNHKGLCPFHAEKSPSFMVSQDKQMWHCFGCAKGGDIFSFVQDIEGLDFPETLRLLAQKAGVTLRRANPAWESKKTKLLDMLRLAADFYHIALAKSHEGERARQYLNGRFLTATTIERWHLGYASEQWDTLLTFLKRKGFTPQDMDSVGLVVRREQGTGYYDRFRGRIIFPISDIHGQVIGFGGRIVDAAAHTAKYINSPQTSIYNKSEVLYGIDQAKESIRKQNTVIVVEGYMDVIGCHQAGFTNVVATSGTALTDTQVKILKRYAPTVILSFDQDPAGEAAAWRGIEVALAVQLNVRVLTVPFGKDPDEACHQDPAAFAQAIKHAQPVMDYYFSSALKRVDAKSVEGKKSLVQTLLPLISRLPDTVEQVHYVQKLADMIRVPEDVLRQKLRSLQKPATTPRHQPAQTSAENRPEKAQAVALSSRFFQLSEILLALLLTKPRIVPDARQLVEPTHLTTEFQQEVYKSIINWYDRGHIGELQAELEQDTRIAAELPRLLLLGSDQFESLDDTQAKQELRGFIRELRLHSITERLRTIQHELISAERMQDDSRVKQLTDESQQLTQQLSQFE